MPWKCRYTYGALVQACARANRPDLAEQYFMQLMETPDIRLEDCGSVFRFLVSDKSAIVLYTRCEWQMLFEGHGFGEG